MPGRPAVGDLDAGDPGRPGTLSYLVLEPIEGLDLALGYDLHASVGQISHPAVKTLPSGGGANKEPKADSLNAAFDEIVSPEAHEGTRKLYPATSCLAIQAIVTSWREIS